ncbi:hypothetical protein ER57_03510 [Smithella sp. SCADC]|jgi:Flp pilus assembly protein TadG|nr:hypothetical protein ER57_03510 [Smithella sp. SCADC]
MKNYDVSNLLKDKGVTAIIVAVLVTVFIGIAALAVDIGYLAMVKNESQNASDAAALAGARQLGENYANKIADPTTNVVSVSQVTAGKNKVAGQNLAVGNMNVKIGIWDPTKADPNLRFTETAVSPMAVQVTTTATTNTFFAKIFNLLNMNMATTATAVIGGPCEGKPTIPLGISETWFNKNPGVDWCGTEIILGDTKDSCAGWTNLSTTEHYSKQDVNCMLICATDSNSENCDKCNDKYMSTMREVTAEENIGFGGGWADVLPNLEDLYNQKKDADDTWTTTVVVYKGVGGTECVQPGGGPDGAEEVIGFATLKITKVVTTGPNMGVTAQVLCNYTMPEPGGCFSGGTLGTIPRLVQ